MDVIIDHLSDVKKSIPQQFSSQNTDRLNLLFSECEQAVAELPEEFVDVKKYCESRFKSIKRKIELLNRTISLRTAKTYFVQAGRVIADTIDATIVKIDAQLLQVHL